MAKTSKSFSGADVLITGGLGFVGSNLAIELAKRKANVTIIDSLRPDYGGSMFNIEPVKDRVDVKVQDLNDFGKTCEAVRGKDFIFHMASQQSHVLWRDEPYSDLDDGIRATVVLLEALKKTKSEPRLVFGGTRGEYGRQKSPVNENAVPNPLGFYELCKLFSGRACELYSRTYGFEFVWARLTNIYGPRSSIKTNASGVVNWFVRLALEGKKIPLYYKGGIARDLLYAGDCVQALLLLADCAEANGEIVNVGSGKPVTLLQVAEKIVEAAGSGSIEFVKADAKRDKQEVGDAFLDVGKLERLTGFRQETGLDEGIRLTANYYKKYLQKYV